MSSLYTYKGTPLNYLLQSGTDTTISNNFAEATVYTYVAKNNSDGNGGLQTDISYNINGTSQGPLFTALNKSASAANGNSWGTNPGFYSGSDDSLGGKGNTNANVDLALSDYVRSPYNFSKLRCILIGGGGGGSW